MRRILLLATLLMAGCTQHHYLVLEEGVPLYAAPGSEVVLAELPQYHHEPLADEAPIQGRRVRIEYRGQLGWAPRSGVDVFGYLSPALDGGDERERVVQAHIREARLRGVDWPSEVVEAVRAGEVFRGMTREQVEVAWGWPSKLQRLEARERWVWEKDDVEVVHTYQPYVYYAPYGCGPGGLGRGGLGWRTGATWVSHRIPVTRRRSVVFDAEGRVVQIDQERVRP